MREGGKERGREREGEREGEREKERETHIGERIMHTIHPPLELWDRQIGVKRRVCGDTDLVPRMLMFDGHSLGPNTKTQGNGVNRFQAVY